MPRYGMVIDLSRCVGCGSCMISCKAEHFLPYGIFWTRLLSKESGRYPAVREAVRPVQCNHCKDAACVKVCPSGATSQESDGVVTVDHDRCIGCRYCMMACPYGARSYHSKFHPYYAGQPASPPELLSREEFQTRVVTKCNFCHDRVKKGLAKGLRPGVDREATPVCVNNCTTKARYFGDLDDPHGEVSKLLRTRRAYQLHPEFGTDPSVFYIE